jgi:hypothetical protein
MNLDGIEDLFKPFWLLLVLLTAAFFAGRWTSGVRVELHITNVQDGGTK